MAKALSLLPGVLLAAVVGCGSAEFAVPPIELSEHRLNAAPATPPPAAPRPLERSIDLSTALRLAAGDNLDILEARARVREAQGRASSADGYLLPILSFGGSVLGTRGNAQSSFGAIQETRFNTVNALGTVQISSNVGESIYKDLAAHRLVEAATGYELAQLQRTFLEVSLEYLSLVEADAAVKIQELFVQEAQELARYTQARESQGLGSALDTERARVLAGAAEQRLILTRNERQRRSKALSATLRLDSTVDLIPVDRDLSAATLIDQNDDLPRWLARGAEHRPEGYALQAGRAAAMNESTATRWSVWGPEVLAGGIFGDLGKSFGTLDERENWILSVGWTLSLGGPGKIEAAEARAEQADIALKRFQDNLQASVAGSYHEYVLSRQRLDPAQRELNAAESALRLANASYQGGLLPENDLLLAQQGAGEARLKRLSAVARFNESQLRLLAESGVASLDTLTGAAPPK